MRKYKSKKNESLSLRNVLIASFFILTFVGFGAFMLSGSVSLSGFQSITGEWNSVQWENAQDTGMHFTLPLEGSTFDWNPDNTYADSGGQIPDGWSDLPSIDGEIENPKFDRHLDYKEWWINDTITETNPTGTAKHFEWSLDVYTVNVNFHAYQGTTYFQNSKPIIRAEFQNNVNSVFENTGAEEAASYIIYAQTEEYSWAPEDAGWHLIQPKVSNFVIRFVDGNVIHPTVPQEGSDLNFDNLAPYSHITIDFEMNQFGVAVAGSEPTVTMIVELDVLTVGRFDYVLTYVEGGENEDAPIGQKGFFASLADAIDAGFSGLMDDLGGFFGDLTGPLVAIAVIAVVILVLTLVVKSFLNRGSKQRGRG
jgi:hypothetical protein